MVSRVKPFVLSADPASSTNIVSGGARPGKDDILRCLTPAHTRAVVGHELPPTLVHFFG